MIGWIREALSSKGGYLSTKRHIVSISAACLCFVFLMIGVASGLWINRNGDLGSGAVAALTFVGGILAGLAGSAYRKPDSLTGHPAAGVTSQSSDVSGTGSAKDRP